MRTNVGWKKSNWRVARALIGILLGCSEGSNEHTVAEDAGRDAALESPSPADAETVRVTPIDRSHLTDVGSAPLDYAEPALWLCRPGNDPNPCIEGLDTTELLKDGTLRTQPHVPAEAPAFDCFYAYPTVDISGGGNTTDFSRIDSILDVLRTQAARFSRICKLFAPRTASARSTARTCSPETRSSPIAISRPPSCTIWSTTAAAGSS